MQRVLVMGCSGSGKTTFARALADKLTLPFVLIDSLFWEPGWREPKKEDFTAIMTKEAEQPAWIMDGNYIRYGAGELRRDRAEIIIWFDMPRWFCLTGALRRIAANHGQVRPEMAPGCPEHFDWKFLNYIWTFRAKQRPALLAYFAALRADQALVAFTRRAQAAAYLGAAGTA